MTDMAVPQLSLIHGDARCHAIAAASIIAKVTRDRMMAELHDRFPDYDFATHKGYVTPEHSVALHAHGPCPEHRASYVNVRRAAVVYGSVPMVARAGRHVGAARGMRHWMRSGCPVKAPCSSVFPIEA